jgi:hypothetical protein
MAVKETEITTNKVIDKKWLQEQFAEMDARTGFVVDKTMTAEKLHALMVESGVRPEDNILSREILRERYPDDFPDDLDE